MRPRRFDSSQVSDAVRLIDRTDERIDTADDDEWARETQFDTATTLLTAGLADGAVTESATADDPLATGDFGPGSAPSGPAEPKVVALPEGTVPTPVVSMPADTGDFEDGMATSPGPDAEAAPSAKKFAEVSNELIDRTLADPEPPAFDDSSTRSDSSATQLSDTRRGAMAPPGSALASTRDPIRAPSSAMIERSDDDTDAPGADATAIATTRRIDKMPTQPLILNDARPATSDPIDKAPTRHVIGGDSPVAAGRAFSNRPRRKGPVSSRTTAPMRAVTPPPTVDRRQAWLIPAAVVLLLTLSALVGFLLASQRETVLLDVPVVRSSHR